MARPKKVVKEEVKPPLEVKEVKQEVKPEIKIEPKASVFTISMQFPAGTTIKSPTGKKFRIGDKGELTEIVYKS